MPNNKLGLISPTIGFAIIAALPTHESGTATTMIQKRAKKCCLAEFRQRCWVWAALPDMGRSEKLTPSARPARRSRRISARPALVYSLVD